MAKLQQVTVDGDEGVIENFTQSKAVNVEYAVSPFERATRSELRERAGWHQTWKRQDEVDQAKEWGYVNIKEAKRSADGSLGKEEAGAETGVVLKRLELNMKDTWEYAMECREELYQQHIEAMAAKSRGMIGAKIDSFHEHLEDANGQVGRRGGTFKAVDTYSNRGQEEPVTVPINR